MKQLCFLKFTFGYLIEDLPMLLTKKGGRQYKMLQDYIEQDSFVLRDRTEWGKRVMTDDLGREQILKKSENNIESIKI